MHIKIAKHYYGQLNTYSLITLMKTDQYIERHNLPKLIKKKKEMDNLNRSVFIDLHGVESACSVVPNSLQPHGL